MILQRVDRAQGMTFHLSSVSVACVWTLFVLFGLLCIWDLGLQLRILSWDLARQHVLGMRPFSWVFWEAQESTGS